MSKPYLSPAQTTAVALVAAVARRDGAAIVTILDGTDDVRTLSLHCATIAARGMKPAAWQAHLDLIAADQAQAFIDTLED